MSLKLLLVTGARPNILKIIPIVREIDRVCKQNPDSLERVLVHTGQHYDHNMHSVFFQELEAPLPDRDLQVGSASHAVQTAHVMIGFEEVCLEEKPDWVVVVGDVNSTIACAMVAVKLGIRVAHVEAGLRSFDRSMPEEINRVLTDSISNVLFTHSPEANENLKQEGVASERVQYVGNVMIDTLSQSLPLVHQKSTYDQYGLEKENYVFLTLHRPSNVDDVEKLRRITEILEDLSSQFPIIFAMHPRTQKNLKKAQILFPKSKRIHIIDPLGYLDTQSLIQNSRFVLTDSGGLQEETTFHRVPCLTLRDNTERPITITKGSNILTNLDNLESDIQETLERPARFGELPDFWDGKAAERIIDWFIKEGR